MLAMTSLVSIAAAAASLQIITPDDIVKMSTEGTAFKLQAGDMTQNYPIPADVLTLQMEAATDGSDWLVKFDPNYPSLKLSSSFFYQPTPTYRWSISAGFDALETGLIFTHGNGEGRFSYWVKVEVLGSAH